MDVPTPRTTGRAIDAYCFVDESKQAQGRYGGVCAISVSAASALEIARELRTALGELRELKFNETGDGRHKRAALRMLAVALSAVERNVLKIDTLTWDRHDSRHTIKGRDDYANLARMLHHRLVHVLLKWPQFRYWHICFDRQDQIDENRLARTVNLRTKEKVAGVPDLFPEEPEILYADQMNSADSVFIQLADLFAGLAVYLRDLDPDDYKSGSKSKRHRSEIIHTLLGWLVAHGTPYFRQGEGLITGRDHSVNFWPYRPQGDYDRAPTREAAIEPKLVACVVCGDVVYDEYGFASPKCLTHYREDLREREEVQQRASATEKRLEGSHCCEQCFERLTPVEGMKRVNQSTWEDEYRHPGCGGLLIEVDPVPTEASDPGQEFEYRQRSEVKRPHVKLDTQHYRDDD